MSNRISKEDLIHIASSLQDVVPGIANKSIFITGGTGFFGKWLLETILYLNDTLKINCSATVLTRNPDKFLGNYTWFKNDSIAFIKGDIKSFPFPEGQFHYCIHAALEVEHIHTKDELEILDDAYLGTHRVLDFAVKQGMQSLLFVSSGGMYGRQPPELRHMPENHIEKRDTTHIASGYNEGKKIGEFLCECYSRKYDLPVKITRPFTFVGPYLTLDGRFAIGNFISNALKNEPIVINSDGTTVRSYMYAADIVIYLFKILIHGENLVPYNLGSGNEISISDLAKKVSSFFTPEPSVIVLKEKTAGSLPERYVPDISRLTDKFPHKQIDLDEAIKRTIAFYSNETTR